MIVTSTEQLTRLVHERLPDDWGERVTAIGDDTVTLLVPWRDDFAGAERWGGGERPVVSGPVTMGIADSAMYACCLAARGPATVPVIVTITSSFLSPAHTSDIVAVARLVRGGRRLSYLDCTLTSVDAPTEFLHTVATYAIRESATPT